MDADACETDIYNVIEMISSVPADKKDTTRFTVSPYPYILPYIAVWQITRD
jgi:hypothetical protein